LEEEGDERQTSSLMTSFSPSVTQFISFLLSTVVPSLSHKDHILCGWKINRIETSW
jgi:hypothetical protein